MPTYIRPARVDISEGGPDIGGLALIAAAVTAVAAIVTFIAAHIVILAVCAGVFIAVMGGVIAAMRWAASPRRLRQQNYPRPVVRVHAARPAQVVSAPRRRAIGRPAETLVHFHGLSAEDVAANIRHGLP